MGVAGGGWRGARHVTQRNGLRVRTPGHSTTGAQTDIRESAAEAAYALKLLQSDGRLTIATAEKERGAAAYSSVLYGVAILLLVVLPTDRLPRWYQGLPWWYQGAVPAFCPGGPLKIAPHFSVLGWR